MKPLHGYGIIAGSTTVFAVVIYVLAINDVSPLFAMFGAYLLAEFVLIVLHLRAEKIFDDLVRSEKQGVDGDTTNLELQVNIPKEYDLLNIQLLKFTQYA